MAKIYTYAYVWLQVEFPSNAKWAQVKQSAHPRLLLRRVKRTAHRLGYFRFIFLKGRQNGPFAQLFVWVRGGANLYRSRSVLVTVKKVRTLTVTGTDLVLQMLAPPRTQVKIVQKVHSLPLRNFSKGWSLFFTGHAIFRRCAESFTCS